MKTILVRDRLTGKIFEEQVFGKKALEVLYGNKFISRFCREWVSKNPLFSKIMGWWFKSSLSRKKISSFISCYGIDTSEFKNPVCDYQSFNAFFTRKLKSESRPVAPGDHIAIMPADGRYLFYPNLSKADGFVVKGQYFSLESLIGDKNLAERYKEGSMVIARLCPSDYHRFHFPIDCIASSPRLINGYLYSVNPWSLASNVSYLVQNKRFVTTLQNRHVGTVLFIEIGATSVGSVIQTYDPLKPQKKGDEKGYFEFGASCLILLFEPGNIRFDADLISDCHQEIRCLMGQSMGKLTK